MQTTSPSSAIRDLIDRFNRLQPDELNEAATRLLLINDLLERVLGWSREHFNPEEYIPNDGKKGREWIDYHLRSGETIRLVVEAKRTRQTFSLPSAKKQRKIPLKQLVNNNKEASAAITQARGYCHRVGTFGFAVTNGFQWIASLSFAPYVPADKLEAIVFYDLEDIASHLQEFIDLLSPEGIASQNLMALAVSGGSLRPTFARRLNEQLRPFTPPDKNYLRQPLTILMKQCFGDLTDADHAEMLEACYVSAEASDEHITNLEAFVGSTLPEHLEFSQRLRRDSTGTSKLTESTALPGASLVVGRAGSGKSTYLAITKRRLETQFARESVLLLNVDLVSRTQTHAEHFDHDRLVKEICSDLLIQANELYSKYDPFANELLREIFSGEIRRLRASMSSATRNSNEAETRIDTMIQEHLKDPVSHLKAYLGYLVRQDVVAIVFLDNVDRGTEEFERVTFLLAQNIAQKTNASVVTSLRDTTYQNGFIGGFLDVSRHNVFHVSPPPFVEVARRRFQYVQRKLKDDPRLSHRFVRAFAGIDRERVFDFADILAELVLGENRDIQDCIQALAGTNIRTALDLLEDFATSANTDLNRLFSQYTRMERRGSGDPGPLLDLFLASIMRMKSLRYAESDSRVVNVFQVSPNIVVSHFTTIRILQLLRWRTKDARDGADIRVEELVGHLGGIGHGAQNVYTVLNHIGKRGLVNSLSQPEPPWSAKHHVRLGAAGRYYLEELIYNREYIQNLTDDTIVYEELVFESLLHLHNDQSIDWRSRYREKARAFLSYLYRREHHELTKMGPTARPAWLMPVVDAIGQRHFGKEFLALQRKTPKPFRVT